MSRSSTKPGASAGPVTSSATASASSRAGHGDGSGRVQPLVHVLLLPAGRSVAPGYRPRRSVGGGVTEPLTAGDGPRSPAAGPGASVPAADRPRPLVSVAFLAANALAYVFTVLAARTLAPAAYGELAALLGVLLVGAVPATGLQTAAALYLGGPARRARPAVGPAARRGAGHRRWRSSAAGVLAAAAGGGAAAPARPRRPRAGWSRCSCRTPWSAATRASSRAPARYARLAAVDGVLRRGQARRRHRRACSSAAPRRRAGRDDRSGRRRRAGRLGSAAGDPASRARLRAPWRPRCAPPGRCSGSSCCSTSTCCWPGTTCRRRARRRVRRRGRSSPRSRSGCRRASGSCCSPGWPTPGTAAARCPPALRGRRPGSARC